MAIRRSEKYDAYYDDAVNKWLEDICSDPGCEFCKDRPVFAKVNQKDALVQEKRVATDATTL